MIATEEENTMPSSLSETGQHTAFILHPHPATGRWEIQEKCSFIYLIFTLSVLRGVRHQEFKLTAVPVKKTAGYADS